MEHNTRCPDGCASATPSTVRVRLLPSTGDGLTPTASDQEEQPNMLT